MEKQQPRIAVLVLGYNDESNLKDTLDSALNQTYKNYEVVYIDNASKDASLSFVQTNYPNLQLVINKTNLGYAGAYAKALTETFKMNFDAAILLNSDVIVDKNWLKELVSSAFADAKIAIAQPKIFLWNENKNLANSFGNKINYLGFGFCGHYKQQDNSNFDCDQEIISASGASLLIKKVAWQRIGNIDEKFFAYLEDQDLSWRAIMQGYKVVLSAKSIMWHKYVFQKNARNSWKFYTLERNRLFFLFKNFSSKTLLLISPMLFVMEIGILADSLNKGYFLDKFRAYKAFYDDFGIILTERKNALKKQKLSDKELFKKLSPVIEFEEINSLALQIANKMLASYYTIIKFLI